MNYVVKYKDGYPQETNLLYVPTMNDEGTILHCDWNYDSVYFRNRKPIGEQELNFFFERETKYLVSVQGKSWAPKLYNIDYKNRTIDIEWNSESLNHIITDDQRDLNKELSDWKEQLHNILSDLNDMGYYKMAIYPHCFFIDKNKQLKAIDYYSIVEKKDPLIPRSMLSGIIGDNSTQRFDDSTTDGMIDFTIFLEITMKDFLKNSWIKENPFPELYERLYVAERN